MLTTPLLFIVFNRPEPTRAVFEQIRGQRPAVLYVAADGPRASRPEDAARCVAVRSIVAEIDWPCRLVTRFLDENQGCRRAVSDALNWFFAHEEEGIVLEDDILPDVSFFGFCAEMLARYRADERGMHVAGFNTCGRWRDEAQAFHFSRFGSIWGWASWRRAWRHYDVNISAWADPGAQRRVLEAHFPRELWPVRKKLYDDLHAGRIDTWDYQWTLCRLLRDGVSIVPARNLVRNIGFGDEATHMRSAPRWVMDEWFSLLGPWKGGARIDHGYDQMHLLLTTHNLSYREYQRMLATRRPATA